MKSMPYLLIPTLLFLVHFYLKSTSSGYTWYHLFLPSISAPGDVGQDRLPWSLWTRSATIDRVDRAPVAIRSPCWEKTLYLATSGDGSIFVMQRTWLRLRIDFFIKTISAIMCYFLVYLYKFASWSGRNSRNKAPPKLLDTFFRNPTWA